MNKVIDLHCDLLAFLEGYPSKTVLDPSSNCSLDQLKSGNVAFQCFAVFTETKKGSSKKGIKQLQIYKHIIRDYSKRIVFGFNNSNEKINSTVAIENLSSLIEEEEPLKSIGFDKLSSCIDSHQPLYISFTWNSENRFGGGNETNIGLKDDGKDVLEFLSKKGVCIDLSHSSDKLAFDILNEIDKKQLDLKVIASHSNFRRILDHPRNLPDELVKEITNRKGIIGLNFVRAFVGDDPKCFFNHIEHAIKLNVIEYLSIGADFFGNTDLPELQKYKPFFLKGFENSSCYPNFIKHLNNHFEKELIDKIIYQNAERFLGEI